MNEVSKKQAPNFAELKEKLHERRAKAPEVSVTMEGNAASFTVGEESNGEEYLRLMAAVGTFDYGFMDAFLGQIANAVSDKGSVSESKMRFALGVVVGLEPRDEVEAMLAAQMAAVHVCAMDTSRRYLWAETLASRDSSERALNKLTRTFAAQMETLKRYRSKAQQVVRVERVTVNEGGRAIVGPVQHGGEGQ
ncbi:hypothetical protein OEZ71_13305 [Defluviimonas sp. WL0050]|uniref:Uncharacterized protein n=1 Tax=Albidovulum litorale TaxID=2984134 RepID=A0ABT2ZR90_9RHOB|nr:hypothetical protein [Defluviimonas sp. WL0050]MCV2873271.1 hypothetical protein [Defluviimonas sp. WL0050]